MESGRGASAASARALSPPSPRRRKVLLVGARNSPVLVQSSERRRVGQTPRAPPARKSCAYVGWWVAGVVGIGVRRRGEGELREIDVCSASRGGGGGPGQWQRIKHGRRRRARAPPLRIALARDPAARRRRPLRDIRFSSLNRAVRSSLRRFR